MRISKSIKLSVRQLLIISLALFLTTILSLSCGNNEEKETKVEETKVVDPTPASYLIESFDTGHKLSSEIRTFVGENLYELINGGAEVYHLYQFIDVSNAYYKAGEIEITADIYQFGTPEMAWGLFSTLRPPEPQTASLGAESFKSTVNTTFVKGQFIVRITGFEPNEGTTETTLKLAQALEKSIVGTTARPKLLDLLPTEGKLPFTEKMYAIDYMGRSGVTEVYTSDYLFDRELVTLFITDDISGGKYAAWSSQLEAEGSMAKTETLPFDKNYSFITATRFYGNIIAGLKNGKLCGMLEYKEAHEEILSTWLKTL